MKLVIDTNIIFSALLSPTGTISDIILNSPNTFEFFAPTYLLDELEKHKSKLLRLTAYTEKELDFLKIILLKKVDLIDLNSIDSRIWEISTDLTKDVDEKDTPFIALSLALKAYLWTGDKKLSKGLKEKGVNWIRTTSNIKKLRNFH